MSAAGAHNMSGSVLATASPAARASGLRSMLDQREHLVVSRLRHRLREIGMSLFVCSDTGMLPPAPAEPNPTAELRAEQHLSNLLHNSAFIADALRRHATGPDGWGSHSEPRASEMVPGLWFAPIPLLARPRHRHGERAGYVVVVVVTAKLLTPGNEHLAAMCQSARVDVELVRRRLRSLPPAPDDPSEVARLLALASFLYEDHMELTTHNLELESTGRQLAESYEEISLLYSIIQNMTAPGMQQPERFVAICCDELLDTLPYAWIGAQLAVDPHRLKQLSGRLFLAGEVPLQARAMRRVTMELLDSVMPDVPMVLEPGQCCIRTQRARAAQGGGSAGAGTIRSNAQASTDPFAALGRSVLVHPVTGGGERQEVVGILIAGGKQGPDQTASNVDMKLLGAVASHMAIFIENAALYEDLNAMFLGTLEALTASIDAKDRYTCGHSQRVAHLTQQLARVIGLDEHQVKRMHIAGLVHDVGKIGVPESLLLKPGKLTEEEFAWIKKHPEMGYRILKDIPQLKDILPGVLHHHERWDGGGYPRGLKGEEIPQVARLIGLADAFDAMSSTRTYRSGMQREQVLDEIMQCAGSQFDPALAAAFVELDFQEYDRLVAEHHAGGDAAAAA